MERIAAALLLLAPLAAMAGSPSAQLRVTVEVRRSVAVAVDPAAATLRVRTAGGAVITAPLEAAGAVGAGAVRVEPSAAEPGYVMVTVLADAPAQAR